MEHDCEGDSDGIISVSLYADRLGASTGLAGFCFYDSEWPTGLRNQSFAKLKSG